jgi:hypothetical protein
MALGSSPASVGQASLLRIPGSIIEWNGVDSTSASSAAFMQGYSSTVGTLIVHIDYHHAVRVEVAGPNTIRVYNGDLFLAHTGSVTLMW